MHSLPIALGLEGTTRFPTVLAHHRSPRVCVTQAAYAGIGYYRLTSPLRQLWPDKTDTLFVDTLLGRVDELFYY